MIRGMLGTALRALLSFPCEVDGSNTPKVSQFSEAFPWYNMSKWKAWLNWLLELLEINTLKVYKILGK